MDKQKSRIIFGLLFLMLIITATWMITIIRGNVPYLDQWTRPFVETIANTKIYTGARWITELGSRSFLVPFAVVMCFIIWRLFQDWFPAVMFGGGTLISHLLNMMIKELVARERPSILIEANAEGFSFPSGHSMTTVVCYGFLIYLLTKMIVSNKIARVMKLQTILLVFMIGMSRYIINVHYLTDVISGFTIGLIVLFVWIHFYEKIQKWRTHKYQS